MSKRAAPRSPSAAPRLFEESAAPEPQRTGSHTFNIDGGSRGNPGPASYGVVVREPGGNVVARLKKYIGRTTNNVAEYYGLIAALDYAQARSLRGVRIESDSELLVKQMRGQYKVKSPDLRPLFEQARKMAQSFASFSITHVYREQNREADSLANQALDETGGASAAAAASPARAAKPSPGRIRARYAGGVLIPREPLDLPEGSEVELQVYQQDKP
jgi:ribonuclease HI